MEVSRVWTQQTPLENKDSDNVRKISPVLRNCRFEVCVELCGVAADMAPQVIDAVNGLASSKTATLFCNTRGVSLDIGTGGGTLRIHFSKYAATAQAQAPRDAQLRFIMRGNGDTRPFRAVRDAATGFITVTAVCSADCDNAAVALGGAQGPRAGRRGGEAYQVSASFGGDKTVSHFIDIRPNQDPYFHSAGAGTSRDGGSSGSSRGSSGGGGASIAAAAASASGGGGDGAAASSDGCLRSPEKKKPRLPPHGSAATTAISFASPPRSAFTNDPGLHALSPMTPATPADGGGAAAAAGATDAEAAASVEPDADTLASLSAQHREDVQAVAGGGLAAVLLLSRQGQIDEFMRWRDLHRDRLSEQDRDTLDNVIRRLQSNVQLRSLSCPLAPLRRSTSLVAALNSLPSPPAPAN